MKPHKLSLCPRCGSKLRRRMVYICPKCGRSPGSSGIRTDGILVYCQTCDHLFIDAFRPPKNPNETQVMICPFCRSEIEVM